jgi:hypothetical protein
MSEEDKKVELTTEQLVNIANQLQNQVKQANAVIQDLSSKIAAREVENSNLRAVVNQITGQAQQAKKEEE